MNSKNTIIGMATGISGLLFLIASFWVVLSPPLFLMSRVKTWKIETAHDVHRRTKNDDEVLKNIMPYKNAVLGTRKMREGESYHLILEVDSPRDPDKGYKVDTDLKFDLVVADFKKGKKVTVTPWNHKSRSGKKHTFGTGLFTIDKTDDYVIYGDITSSTDCSELAEAKLYRFEYVMVYVLAGVFFLVALIDAGICLFFLSKKI